MTSCGRPRPRSSTRHRPRPARCSPAPRPTRRRTGTSSTWCWPTDPTSGEVSAQSVAFRRFLPTLWRRSGGTQAVGAALRWSSVKAKGAAMPHMVIFRDAEGRPGYHQADALDDAVRFVEDLRNEQQVTDTRVFSMEE